MLAVTCFNDVIKRRVEEGKTLFIVVSQRLLCCSEVKVNDQVDLQFILMDPDHGIKVNDMIGQRPLGPFWNNLLLFNAYNHSDSSFHILKGEFPKNFCCFSLSSIKTFTRIGSDLTKNSETWNLFSRPRNFPSSTLFPTLNWYGIDHLSVPYRKVNLSNCEFGWMGKKICLSSSSKWKKNLSKLFVCFIYARRNKIKAWHNRSTFCRPDFYWIYFPTKSFELSIYFTP